jgi:hypothetical protein
MIERFERPLTMDERSGLEGRLARLRAEPASTFLKTAVSSVVVCAGFCALTLLASDAPRTVVLAFWGVLAAIFTVWIGIGGGRAARRQATWVQQALGYDRARVVRIQSSRVVEFEEIEDEGACFAFEVNPGQVVFILGQEFYADDSFPNSDLSIVDLLAPNGMAVDMLLLKEGRKLEPVRQIDAATKDVLEIPEHLETVAADLDHVEHVLPRTGPRR